MFGERANVRVTAQEPVPIGSYRESGELVDIWIVPCPRSDPLHTEDIPVHHQPVIEVAAAEVLVLKQQIVGRAEPQNSRSAHIEESKAGPNSGPQTVLGRTAFRLWFFSSLARRTPGP